MRDSSSESEGGSKAASSSQEGLEYGPSSSSPKDRARATSSSESITLGMIPGLWHLSLL